MTKSACGLGDNQDWANSQRVMAPSSDFLNPADVVRYKKTNQKVENLLYFFITITSFFDFSKNLEII